MTLPVLQNSELTEQQLALKKLTEQVEQQRKQLELRKAQLAQQAVTPQPEAPQEPVSSPPQSAVNLPKTISDIMSGKAMAGQPSDPRPLNMMDYLKRTAAAKQLSAPPLPPTLLPTMPPASQPADISSARTDTERPKISFSFAGAKSIPQPSQPLVEEEAKPHRPYLPPSSQTTPPQSKPALLAPPLPPPPLPSEGHAPSNSQSNHSMMDPRIPSVSERSPFAQAHYNNMDEDYRRADFRPVPPPASDNGDRRWSQDDRSRWRGSDYREGGGYQRSPMQRGGRGGYDNRNRNRDGFGAEDRYRRN